MPGVSGVTVVTNARAYYHYTRGCGRIGARHSLRPLIIRRREVDSKARANVLRDREAVARAIPSDCHHPPTGPAFGRPDDRLRRVTQYSRDIND